MKNPSTTIDGKRYEYDPSTDTFKPTPPPPPAIIPSDIFHGAKFRNADTSLEWTSVTSHSDKNFLKQRDRRYTLVNTSPETLHTDPDAQSLFAVDMASYLNEYGLTKVEPS